MDFKIFGNSLALSRCRSFLCLCRLGVFSVMTNYRGNQYYGVVLCFCLFLLFCYTDGRFMDFVILWNSIALPRCIDF